MTLKHYLNYIIDTDIVLRFNIREAMIDPNLIEHQSAIKLASLRIALFQAIDKMCSYL